MVEWSLVKMQSKKRSQDAARNHYGSKLMHQFRSKVIVHGWRSKRERWKVSGQETLSGVEEFKQRSEVVVMWNSPWCENSFLWSCYCTMCPKSSHADPNQQPKPNLKLDSRTVSLVLEQNQLKAKVIRVRDHSKSRIRVLAALRNKSNVQKAR